MIKKIKSKKFVLLLLLNLITGTIFSQTTYSLRTNAGFAYDFRYAYGYYYSFEVGIPITKSLEVASSFCNTSMTLNKFLSFQWDTNNLYPGYGYSYEGPKNNNESRIEYGTISLLLFFKPLELFEKSSFKNHEIYIGSGISYVSYSEVFVKFDLTENDYNLESFHLESNREFNINYLKFGYNYYFNRKFAGIVFALNGYHDEAVMNIGLQFGILVN